VSGATAERLRSLGWVPDTGSTTTATTPAKSAPKAEWVQYATTQGMDQAEAEELTKADLVDRYS
jgi:hypothetical protein